MRAKGEDPEYTLPMALSVHMLQGPDRELMESLAKLLRKGITVTCSEKLPEPADYDILVSGVPDREAIDASTKLRALIIPWAGLPRKTRDLMRDYPGIAIHNIHHNALPAAEMAITLMVAVAKDLLPIDGAFRRGDWSKRYNPSSSIVLAGKNVLVLGYGAIGKEIAVRCLGLGMTVSAIGSAVSEGPGPHVDLYPRTALHDLLPRTDILLLSLPMTAKTKGLIGDRELSLLSDGAIVINISRGRIMDEEALYRHLKSGRLRAGLDVWYSYPETVESRTATEPSEFPFHDLPNVVMTPHLAGHSDLTEHLRARELARLLNLAAEGKPMPNRIDLEAGY